MVKKLLNQRQLHKTDVVANNLMNRERGVSGKNSYQKDLSFNPLEFLQTRFIDHEAVSWLDICCGRGRALIETAEFFAQKYPRKNLSNKLHIVGIDLVGGFYDYSPKLEFLNFLEMAIEDCEPEQEFDLITCVHGLHYIGDKLSAIQKAAALLRPDGIFLANLDLQNLKLTSEGNSVGIFSKLLKTNEFTVQQRKKLISLAGKHDSNFPLEYVGADAQAGPNYTGQAAVDSFYKLKNQFVNTHI